jgi:hypothetical protein
MFEVSATVLVTLVVTREVIDTGAVITRATPELFHTVNKPTRRSVGCVVVTDPATMLVPADDAFAPTTSTAPPPDTATILTEVEITFVPFKVIEDSEAPAVFV